MAECSLLVVTQRCTGSGLLRGLGLRLGLGWGWGWAGAGAGAGTRAGAGGWVVVWGVHVGEPALGVGWAGRVAGVTPTPATGQLLPPSQPQPPLQTTESQCTFYDRLPPADFAPLPHDYATEYTKYRTGA